MNKIVIIIILLGSFKLSAQDSLIKGKNIDTIQKDFKIQNDKISNDTLVIINKMIIEQGPMNRFWDRILPIIGILIASLTLIYVRINYRIDKLYGGWSNWKEYLRLKKKLNSTKSDYFPFKNVLKPIVDLNPLDFVEKVKEEDPGMFKYEDEKLKDSISKMYSNLHDKLKGYISGAYLNYIRSDRPMISHRTGQNDKFKDGREFFFTGEAQSLINSISDRIKTFENKIQDLSDKMKDIKVI